MDDTVICMHANEQHLASRDVGPQAPAHGSSRMGARSMPQPRPQAPATAAGAQASTTAKTSSFVKRLTTTEIAERRKDGRCFHCDEPFIDGHKLVCRQLFSIELIHDDEQPVVNEDANPTIFIHALTGIAPHSGRTMVTVIINTVPLTTLFDSGSTYNFVDTDATARAGLRLAPRDNLCVAVANGDYVSSPGGCCNVSISIRSKVFIIESYGLELAAYNMVLGVQWLESLGLILWDFGQRTMAFVRNGC
jgi:hypothetical protein